MSKPLAWLVAAILALTSAATLSGGAGVPGVADRAAGNAAASADLVPAIEYTLLAGQFNLVTVRPDEVFFTAGGNCLGRLDAAARENSLLCRQGTGASVWDLQPDAAGNLWFSARDANAVGFFQPSLGTFTEWRPACNGAVYGMDVDEQSGDVWFTCSGAALLYRLQPATNQLTSWAVSPYTCCYDVDWDPATASLWFVAQGCGSQGVGRLQPASDRVTVWSPPSGDSRPCAPRVSGGSVWFAERGSAANAIAELLPASNTLREYRIPLANADASTCLPVGDSIWFTGWGSDLIGRLHPPSAQPTITSLTPVSLVAQRSVSTLQSTRYAPAETYSAAAPAITTNLTRTVSGGFTLYRHPWTGIHPSGLALDASSAYLWYGTTQGKRIGRIATGLQPPTPSPTATHTRTPTRTVTPGPIRVRLYLPVILRP